MFELYNTPHSTCSQKVRLCLAEKKASWTDVHIDIANNEHLTPEYLTINPNGVVPTLCHNGNFICDSSVICEYLDEIIPEPALIPKDPVKRAEMRTWMRFIEEVPTVAVRVPSFNMAFLPRYKGLNQTQFREKQSDIRPIRKQFYRRMGPAGFEYEDFEAALEQIRNSCHRMEKALVDDLWLAGSQYTLADIIMAPLIDRMEDLGFAYLWNEKYPRMKNWMSVMKSRPAYKKAFPKGCRLSEMHELVSPSR